MKSINAGGIDIIDGSVLKQVGLRGLGVGEGHSPESR